MVRIIVLNPILVLKARMETDLRNLGLTETSTVVCSSTEEDIYFGSSGILLPGFRAKILTPEGVEITTYNEPGELVVQSHSVVLGYLNNDQANQETFIEDTDGNGKWMRTGDEAVVRKNPQSGNEHIWIVDRIKELIKVKVRWILTRSPEKLSIFLQELTLPYRDSKSPLQNSKPTSSPTLRYVIAR